MQKQGNQDGLSVTRKDNFSEWYIQVLTKAELIEYTDISGCYTLRPNAFAIWEVVTRYFDDLIKKDGVKNAYFPCFVSSKALKAEEENFKGFCPEVAWVTQSGDSELPEPIAVRPTSETIMYPMFGKWVRSHRDLPMRLNQWCNVVRWEMKRCVPFLRSREFLWQEGHSVYATEEEADKEVLDILEFYRSVYEDVLAVPVTKGRKTDMEKFAGAAYTTTIEAYIAPNGRAIQAATSHSLGQNFSKIFKIQFEDQKGEKQFGWQNSWGLSTRSLGVAIMIHGDDKGLRLPPRAAPTQIVIVCIPRGQNVDDLLQRAKELSDQLTSAGIRVEIDSRKEKPGWKYNYWEVRGVPIRFELGERDVTNKTVMACRRDTLTKQTISWDGIVESAKTLLDDIHQNLFNEAKKQKTEHTKQCTSFSTFIEHLSAGNICLVPFCCKEECEEKIKVRSREESKAHSSDEGFGLTGSAKSLCIPFVQPSDLTAEVTPCFGECGANAQSWCLFGRSY